MLRVLGRLPGFNLCGICKRFVLNFFRHSGRSSDFLNREPTHYAHFLISPESEEKSGIDEEESPGGENRNKGQVEC
jgi:hypothetical protein